MVGLLAGTAAVKCLDLPMAGHGSDDWVKAFARAALEGDKSLEDFLHMVKNMQTRAMGNIQEHVSPDNKLLYVSYVNQ